MTTRQPVTPDATGEAEELLAYLYRISGAATLTGQHCQPLGGSSRLSAAENFYGRHPAVFGQDFGFARRGSWDGANFRQHIVDEAVRRHRQGYLNTICWHAARPDHDEPVTFEGSVQAPLSDAQWAELLTPGTALHARWCASVDVIAWFLRQLLAEGVPVLWRPYHEMNGDWFWWGNRPAESTALYRMLFERFSQFHGLANLIWVWSPNDAARPEVGPYPDYYPGHDVVDVLACDIYRPGFDRGEHDALAALGEGRPIALGEVGEVPTVEQLTDQRRWVWFMGWWEPVMTQDLDAARQTYASGLTLNAADLPGARPPFD